MRNLFRTVLLSTALALCSAISLSAQAVEYVVLRPLGSLLAEGTHTMAKFKADLAQMQAGREEVVKIDFSLQRDGNGLRQDTAFTQAVLNAIKTNRQYARTLLS